VSFMAAGDSDCSSWGPAETGGGRVSRWDDAARSVIILACSQRLELEGSRFYEAGFVKGGDKGSLRPTGFSDVRECCSGS